MMKFVIKEGTTVEEAVNLAVEELGIKKSEAEVQVLEEYEPGFLGLFGKKLAKVKVNLLFDEVSTTKEIIEGFFKLLHIDVDLEVTKTSNNTIKASISNENLGYLIGKHGTTLASLEQLFSLAINKLSPYRLSLVLDIGGYMEKRKESLEHHALGVSKKIVKTKRKYQFEPMSSYERKIIHTVLQEIPNIKTYSVGTSPNRKVVAEYKG